MILRPFLFLAALLAVCADAACAREVPYQFREFLEQVHQPDRRDVTVLPAADEFVFRDGCRVPTEDFADYLRTSMNVRAVVDADAGDVGVSTDPALPKRTYVVDVTREGVRIVGADRRACEQALYHLEDLMNLRRAPYLKIGHERRRMLYSPRMLHSGWGVDRFPDRYLLRMAHYGYDAILVFVKGVGETQGEGRDADIAGLIRRAKAVGIDVYLYAKLRAFVHPSAPDARAVFDGSYGRLAADYPEARGIVLVGESCEFPSKDPRTSGKSYLDPRPADDKRPDPAWFPCSDYPDWIRAVRDAVKARSPKMEVVFWTYNWGYAPEEECRKVLQRFPEDVVLNLTCHRGARAVHANGYVNRCDDYTISVPGPSEATLAEVDFAREAGRPFYMMANTGGLTWDFGCIPYEPFPFQWKARWESLGRIRRADGLSGLMESHHFGWYPNFVSELAKEAFTEGGLPFDAHLRAIAARDFGEANAEAVVSVWKNWSRAIADYPATDMNEYGPFRLGPAYPFAFGGPGIAPRLGDQPAPADSLRFPAPSQATHRLGWMCNLNYTNEPSALAKSAGLRYDVNQELELLGRMRDSFRAGADVFARLGASKMETLGRYLQRTTETAVNVKTGCEAFCAGDRTALLAAARKEYDNARAALDLVERDSRLGWEPTMEYAGGADQIRWKLSVMERLYPQVVSASATAEKAPSSSSFARVETDASALPASMRFVAGLLADRVAERTPPTGGGASFKVRYVPLPALEGGQARVDVFGDEAVVSASDVRGFLAGTGNLLKSLKYGRSTFSATDGSYDFRPAKSLRIAYLARHFLNPYMEAPAEEMCRYIDDLALDGINAYNFQIHMPAVDVARSDDREKSDFLRRSRAMVARIRQLGCDLVGDGGSNQLPMNSPEEYRAAPNRNPKAPPTGFNACPAKPRAFAELMRRRRESLAELADVKFDYLVNWPYDEGGCGCDTCHPWGCNGFLEMCRKFRETNVGVHRNAKTILSTWFFTDEEYAGLWDYLKTHDWIDYLLVDDFGTEYPKYPREHPLPGKTKIITFPEISMWGRTPWGGYGAIALPRHLMRLFRQSAEIAEGFEYYSEGFYEDINKAVVTSLYVDPTTTLETLLARYSSYHFAGADPADFVRLAFLLEDNHRPTFLSDEKVEEAVRLARKMDAEILPELRKAWRWRIVLLRTLIDREIFRARSLQPAAARPYFDELVKIYHAERQIDWILDGRMGGWTSPRYLPEGRRFRNHEPPAGDATETLRKLVEDTEFISVRLGRGSWKVGGDVRLSRSRFELVLEDGCRLEAGGSGRMLVGEGVDGVTVRGEGHAVIGIPVEIVRSKNVVLKGVVVSGENVRLTQCEDVRVDLASRASAAPLASGMDGILQLDRAIEWADQHLEQERVERLCERLERMKGELK